MLNFFPMPAGLAQRLDKLRRNFFGQRNKKRKGYHPIKWKVLIREKNKDD